MTLPLNPPSGPVTLTQNARTVLEKRYLVKNEKGQPVEQPEDLFWRVSTVVAAPNGLLAPFENVSALYRRPPASASVAKRMTFAGAAPVWIASQ